MQVPGTSVAALNVDGGVALIFVNSAGNVGELRQVVLRMSEIHNRQFANGGMILDDHRIMNTVKGESRDRHRLSTSDSKRTENGSLLPAATATAEDIDGGARLVLHAATPVDVEAIRMHGHMRASRMASGDCPLQAPGTAARPRTASDAGSTHH